MKNEHEYIYYAPQEVFGEKLEHNETVLHSGLVHNATTALLGCMLSFFTLLPVAVFIILGIVLTNYYLIGIAAAIILLDIVLMIATRIKNPSLSPVAFTDRRIITKIKKEFETVNYKDIHEIRYDYARGEITVVAYSPERAEYIRKISGNKGSYDDIRTSSAYIELLYLFTEQNEEAYNVLCDASEPFVKKNEKKGAYSREKRKRGY